MQKRSEVEPLIIQESGYSIDSTGRLATIVRFASYDVLIGDRVYLYRLLQ